MGAEFHMDEVPEAPTLKDAYYKAVERAQWESGHGGYTGTIAESQGFKETGMAFATLDEAYDWAGAHAEKWGPALVVTVGAKRYFAGCYSS
jgi:hypothetical protein